MKKILGLLAALALAAVISCSVLSSPATGSVSALQSADSSQVALLDTADAALTQRLKSLISLNAVFDDCVGDTAALVDAASALLEKQAIQTPDGRQVISKAAVQALIFDLYGVEVNLSTLPAAYTAGAPAGYLNLLDNGDQVLQQTLTSARMQEDGTIAATAALEYEGETLTVDYTFAISDASQFGYVILAADIVPEEAVSSYAALSLS